jgi:hypothetical protein
MSCPYCARKNGDQCGEYSPIDPEVAKVSEAFAFFLRYQCTRPKGHEGDHIACGTKDHPVKKPTAKWPQEKTE